MRSKLTLLTNAALALGLTAGTALAAEATGDAPGAKSDITIVGKDTGNAPGVAEQNAQGQGATDEGGAATPDAGAAVPDTSGGGTAQLPPASDEGSAGATGGADDQGAAGKSTEDLGAPAAAKPDAQKEGKLPSPSSAY
jgi:hypothetical protein